MTKHKHIKSIILGITLASTAACAPQSLSYNGAEVQKRNLVNHVRLIENLEISNINNARLSAGTKEQINSFLTINRVGYGDTVSLDVGDDENAAEIQNSVRKYLLGYGIVLEERAPITGALPKAGHGILIVDRFVVTPPNCHSSSTQGQNVPVTINSSSFGCSTQVNLGLMVANPQDLIEPQETGATNAEVSIAAVRDYRQGIPVKNDGLSSPLSGGSK